MEEKILNITTGNKYLAHCRWVGTVPSVTCQHPSCLVYQDLTDSFQRLAENGFVSYNDTNVTEFLKDVLSSFSRRLRNNNISISMPN